MDVNDIVEYPEDVKRREIQAAHTRWANSDQAKQMLMPYRNSKNKLAAIESGFEFKPGYIYTQVRAISSRINQNYDAWPSEELKKSYRTFIGKPCFVNHQNFDYKKARGKVVAARYIESGDDKYVETVMEIDAQRFPKLAHEIKTGGLDSVSMGVEAGFTKCSICDNKAVDVPEFCAHVKYHKGSYLPHVKTGKSTLCYENCFKLGFFELSYVFDPADETAVVSRVIAASNKHAANLTDDNVAKANWASGGAPEATYSMPHPAPVGGAPGDTTSSEWDKQNSGASPTIQTARRRRAQEEAAAPPTDEIVEGQMPTGQMPTAALERQIERLATGDDGGQDLLHSIGGALDPNPMHWMRDTPQDDDGPTDNNPEETIVDPPQPKMKSVQARLEARIHRLAYGEAVAPEDVDTLRDESDDDTDDFKHYVESPKELQAPNLDRTQQLDRAQETEGLDTPRRVEQVEDVGGHLMGQDPVKDDRRDIEEIKLMAAHRGPATLVDPRTGRRYYAADEDEQGPPPDFGGGGDDSDFDDAFPPEDDGGKDYSDDGAPGDDDGGGDDGSGKSDEELLQEAEDDLQQAEDAGAGNDPTDMGDDDDFGDEEGGDSADDFPGDDGEADAGGGDDLPPWLAGGGDDHGDDEGPPREARRRRTAAPSRCEHGTGDGRCIRPHEHEGEHLTDAQVSVKPRKARRNQKGRPMSLSQRNRVASAGRRRHYADESGHTDGGPYGEDNQGEQEDVFLSQTPGEEAVAAPTPGDGTISNTEGNLVEGRLRRRIQQRNAELRRDLIAYEQITGKRIGTRRTADDGEWPNPGPQSVSGAEAPDEVDPALSGTDEQGLKGDFDSIALDNAETQPKDASVHAFRAFDAWLKNTTGRTARQHGNPNFIRRTAAQFCSANRVSVESLFPTLGSVLREARKNERSATMRRRADESLDVAAPQDRIDVEAPVRDTTDADAQASQYSPSDFGDNAGDNLADPELSTDSQIWAPGEGDSAANKRDANRKADGMTAVRYAEAYIAAGLAPNTPDEKWKIAGMAQMMRHATIVDRIGMLDAINSVNRSRQASARRTAGVTGGSRIPQGVSQRQMTAGTSHTAANDTANDFALFMKG